MLLAHNCPKLRRRKLMGMPWLTDQNVVSDMLAVTAPVFSTRSPSRKGAGSQKWQKSPRNVSIHIEI